MVSSQISFPESPSLSGLTQSWLSKTSKNKLFSCVLAVHLLLFVLAVN